jgi:hypothetical protein
LASAKECFISEILYIIFIEFFSKVAHLITLLQKGTKFEWISKCEESFHHLKELLTSAPILKVVDPKEDFFCAQMHARKGLVESLHKMGMSCIMSQGGLKSMK